MDFKKKISELVTVDGVSPEEIASYIQPVSDQLPGDFSLPCFRFAKQMRKAPAVIASELASSVRPDPLVEKVEAVNGYLNFFLNREKAAEEILSAAEKEGSEYGNSALGNGKTICIDYSSINIAKPFHIGHLGTTAIGSALYKIYKRLGYNVVGINHLGDYGTQFGKLIVAFKKWGSREAIDKGGVKALQEIYVRFHREEENDPSLTDEAREWFVKVENKDPEAMELFEYFKEITLKDVRKVYDRPTRASI